MSSGLLAAASFLATFAVHSTVLVLAVLVLRHFVRREAVEEILWRFAMLGGVVTATAQCYLGYPALPGLSIDMTTQLSQPVPAAAASSTFDVGGAKSADADPYGTDLLVADPGLFADWSYLEFVLLAYAVCAAVVLALLLRGFQRWHRVVRDRSEVTDPFLLTTLARLRVASGLRRPVRLSTAMRITSPAAFGWFAGEICLPRRVSERMDETQQECVLAHEVAHLRDGDPWWSALYELLTGVFFFQPLLLVARRRLADLAEFRCDAWVVAHTGDRVGMAKTLLEVAEWLAPRDRRLHAAAAFVPGMAHRDSPLAVRVRRILHATTRPLPPRRMLVAPVLCLMLSGFAYGVPGVRLELPPPATTPIQKELIRLEQEIAEMHQALAELWRNLEGRDLPRSRSMLQTFEQRLQRITHERMALWSDARSFSAPAPAQIPADIPRPIQRARLNPEKPDSEKVETNR